MEVGFKNLDGRSVSRFITFVLSFCSYDTHALSYPNLTCAICDDTSGRSTLPCVKLRAVVDAAKEISQLDAEERSVFPDATFFDATVVTKVKALGADDFLPIFIYCFVQAKIERPSALCKLKIGSFFAVLSPVDILTAKFLLPAA